LLVLALSILFLEYGMVDILGKTQLEDLRDNDLQAQVLRKAWHLLSDYGTVDDESIDVSQGLCDDEIVENYEVISTSGCRFGASAEYEFWLGQLPDIDGKLITDIGNVVLNIVLLDEDEVPEVQQQIIFQQESHLNGPGVFVGDVTPLLEINKQVDLLQLLEFLEMLEEILWRECVNDGDSAFNALPRAGSIVEFESLLSDDQDL
jgi:hypothetical protein